MCHPDSHASGQRPGRALHRELHPLRAPGPLLLTWPSVLLKDSGPFDIGTEGATVKLQQGHGEPAAIAGMALIGSGAVAVLVTTIATMGKKNPSSWTPYEVAFAISGGALVLGTVMLAVALPRVKVGEYRAAGTQNAATLSAAPLAGGAVMLGTLEFWMR